MTIMQEPFVRYNEDKKCDTFTVKLNPYERKIFDSCKSILNQPKDSTAIKQLAFIGAKVLDQDSTVLILDTVFKNKRKNYRTGVSVEFE